MRHILSVLLENEAGALARVVGLFAQRGYNIESLTVAPTNDDSMSRITVTTFGNDQKIEQITKQLNKLIEVIKAADLGKAGHVEQELLLVKVAPIGAKPAQAKRLAELLQEGCILDSQDAVYIARFTGTCEKIDQLLTTLDSAARVLEVVRSGVLGVAWDNRMLQN